MRPPAVLFLLLLAVAATPPLLAQAPRAEPREYLPAPWDAYFQMRVEEISSPAWLDEITRENWPQKQKEMRAELQQMLGLSPWPERTPLQPEITGTIEGDGYVVEKLHFQSSPQLYVTANLYRPKTVEKPLPAILYVCGHSHVVENGVSLGNKTGYQHHGIWFARHGYVCLVLDTIQLGEIQGEHHGTYRLKKWWWPARGYTPAGVEAWNGIRALDYLETRPEVDRTRIGMTGRSGGGAYSWWVAALDDRIAATVPTAGITTQHNHIIDGAIEGHCDCMYMVNTARWDFDRVAALVAPRPLLIANTDKDEIFPLDGVVEIYHRTRALYRKLGKEEQIGLHIAEGPHKDTQPLNTGAFEWMNRFLKGADRMELIDEPARKILEPRELKVFAALPSDEKVTSIDQTFVPAAKPPGITTAAEWPLLRDGWMKALREESFRAWPAQANATAKPKSSRTADGLTLAEYSFTSDGPIELNLWLLRRADLQPEQTDRVVLAVLDDAGWAEFQNIADAAFPEQFAGATPDERMMGQVRTLLHDRNIAVAVVCPRGAGADSWTRFSEKKQTQLRRRLLLLGESLESGQVWDIRQAAAAVRSLPGMAEKPLVLRAENVMAANALYASLFLPGVEHLELKTLPASHRGGPIYLNVLRHLDVPQAVAMAAERSSVAIETDEEEPWDFARETAAALQWGENRVRLRGTSR